MINWEELEKRFKKAQEESCMSANRIDTFMAWAAFMELMMPVMKEFFEELYEWKKDQQSRTAAQ